MLLSRRSKSLKDLVNVLAEYRDNINVGEVDEDDRGPESEAAVEMTAPTEGEVQRGILAQLVEWLDSVA